MVNPVSLPESKLLMPSLFIHDHALASTTPSLVPFTKNQLNVRRESNRRLPILRIYPDLLEYIFILCANLEKTIQQRRRTVISYSQTCHDWRTVAISAKPLWSGLVDFEGNSKAWNNELLRRSYPFPIVVGSISYARRDSHTISAELAHLERIRIYRIGFEASSWSVLVEGLQKPAPHIEYLNINHINHSAIDSFILPSTLFAGDAPHLKRLEMTECLIDFRAPVLRSLTTLSVENLNTLIAPTALEWLEHLSRLPLLASLRLGSSMRPQDHSSLSISEQRTDQVKLSLLSTLNLDASLHDTHTFIKGLNFPDSCSLMVRCSECYPGPELDTVLSAYLCRLDYGHHLQPENCPFSIYARRSTLSIWNELSLFDPSDNPHAAKPPTLCLDLYMDSFEFGFWDSLLTPVLFILRAAFSKFTSLELQLPDIHQALFPCLARATKLTRLANVSAIMTKKLLSQFIQPSGFVVPLPALHTIVFTNDESMWGAPYRAFVSFLIWRQTVGYPITRVSFRQCLVLDDTILSLESLGVQVDCDLEGTRWQRL